MRFLVCGGAGYIGSHMAKRLFESDHEVTVLDNLSTGHRDAVRWGELAVCDLQDGDGLEALFAAHRFDGVLHFAARSLVGESMQEPSLYYRNNVAGTLCLLDVMRRHGVDRFIFSSTAAVYGNPEQTPISESHPQRPINPYGESKKMVESILADYARAYGLRSASLRYFNAAGADPLGRIGERHEPETHLIPNALAAAAGRGALTLFGDDYPTPDGTCVRDYVHVDDLCEAHLLALALIAQQPGAHAFNLGNGSGFSVREVIDSVERVTGNAVPHRVASRRAGDPPVLVADSRLARERLGWVPVYTSLDAIVKTAWDWECRASEATGGVHRSSSGISAAS